uniref:Uncharacterized protein n=1 Tax=Anguilla anguilla TaxID=7936 RepID=A0A0E9U8K9_ANGAN
MTLVLVRRSQDERCEGTGEQIQEQILLGSSVKEFVSLKESGTPTTIRECPTGA